EYKNLVTAFNSGIRVPRPIAVMKNVLVMEFIGENGNPAPLLNEVRVSKADYKKVISIIKNMYRKAKLVHADLSEYNIFKWRRELIVFDFGSAVDIGHPSADQFLMRDISNINRFFMKRGIDVEPEDIIFKRVVGNEL
ncbi:MAG: AarF/UbiB family protein, partial [Nitrososphaerales archaeon]|nr:AarF/UbiB family protein [Nitrososphaerales archaeon]